jgi:hypothetical protein
MTAVLLDTLCNCWWLSMPTVQQQQKQSCDSIVTLLVAVLCVGIEQL